MFGVGGEVVYPYEGRPDLHSFHYSLNNINTHVRGRLNTDKGTAVPRPLIQPDFAWKALSSPDCQSCFETVEFYSNQPIDARPHIMYLVIPVVVWL